MTEVLRTLPDIALIALFGVGALVILAACAAVARRVGLRPSVERGSAVFDAYKIIATFAGLLLGFSLVQAQNNFRATDQMISREAGVINHLDRILLRYGEETRISARGLLHDYAVAVIGKDWPAMRRGQGAPEAGEALARLNRTVLTLPLEGAPRPQLYAEMLKLLDDMNDARQERLDTAALGLSRVLWQAIFCLLGLMLVVAVLIDTPHRLIAFGGPAMALSVLSALVFSIDEPFKGQTSIGPGAIERVLVMIDARRD